mmetsp:Transcript_28394/g.71435  ORF Transcript_28394/g.71435 Transcript_28394/m.71435 type:complete len:321 (-) Transcript_28394:673-1635(-)
MRRAMMGSKTGRILRRMGPRGVILMAVTLSSSLRASSTGTVALSRCSRMASSVSWDLLTISTDAVRRGRVGRSSTTSVLSASGPSWRTPWPQKVVPWLFCMLESDSQIFRLLESSPSVSGCSIQTTSPTLSPVLALISVCARNDHLVESSVSSDVSTAYPSSLVARYLPLMRCSMTPLPPFRPIWCPAPSTIVFFRRHMPHGLMLPSALVASSRLIQLTASCPSCATRTVSFCLWTKDTICRPYRRPFFCSAMASLSAPSRAPPAASDSYDWKILTWKRLCSALPLTSYLALIELCSRMYMCFSGGGASRPSSRRSSSLR